mgnify:CR=1 FL=1
MLVQQTSALPGEVQYFIDGACEEHELLGCHHVALTLYGDRARLAEIVAGTVARIEPEDVIARAAVVDAGRTPRNWRAGRLSIALALAEEAASLIRRCPFADQVGFAALGYGHLRLVVRDHAEFFASWRFEDATTGGAAKPFLKHWRLDRQMRPTPAVRRHLASPKAIRRYVKHNQEWRHVRALYETIADLPLPCDVSAGERLIEALKQRANEQRSRMYADLVRRAPRSDPKIVRKIQAASRKVTKRAAVMAAALLGASTVSAFARGEPVIIPAKDIAFRVVAAGSMDHLGHGALHVDLQTLEGQRLSGLCVYFDKTPALDQLSAIALHAAAGEEATVIRAGNLYAVEAAAAEHPALAGRATPIAAQVPEIMSDRARIEMAKAEHLALHGAIYREATAIAILGRRARFILEVQ